MFAFVASMIYVATPLSARYLRLAVVDNFMTLFLLLSVLLVLTRPSDRVFSAISFGAAVLCKQTAIFFLPALLLFFWRQKRPLSNAIVWLTFAAVLPVVWAVYGIYDVGLSSLLSSQIGLTSLTGERAVSAVGLIIQRISSRDPFTFLGLAGVVWAIYKRDSIVAFPIAYLGSFVVLFLRISTVYLIPALPFLALVAAELFFDLVDLVPRLPSPLMFRRVLFGGIVILLIASSIFIVVTQSPSMAQQDAVNFVVSQHPSGVIMSYTYLWLFQQNNPSITIYDRYAVPWDQLVNKTVYLMVDYPGDLNTIDSIPQYQRLYQNSTLVWTESTYGYTVQVLKGVVT
jgi:4-amino-4-deoxy-L-arabinose transferase-like glycosyltransferase